RPHGDAGRATERAQEGRADVTDHLALELDALALGLVQLARGDEAFALAQVRVELLAEPAHGPDGQGRVREPVRVRAQKHGVEAGEGRAGAHARGERERNDDGLLRVLPRPVVGAEESDRGGRGQAGGARAEVVVLAQAFGLRAGALSAALDGLRAAPRRAARRPRALFYALAYVVPLVQLARLAPRGLAPLVKLVTVVSHNHLFECRVQSDE